MSYEGWHHNDMDKIEVPNPEVLRAGIKHAETHLRNWHQGTWASVPFDQNGDVSEENCGTTACLAGHILLAGGWSWVDLRNRYIATEALEALGFRRDGDGDWDDHADRFDSWIFCKTMDEDDSIAYSVDQMARFKDHITKLTGITFDNEEEDQA